MTFGESPYLYGIHASSAGDGWDSTGADLLDRQGWIVFTEAIGRSPSDESGHSYVPWAEQDLGIIVRLNHGYNPHGTIPLPAYYDDFALRCRNYVAASPGCHIWIIGNESNHAQERPDGQIITPQGYAACYHKCREQIKILQPEAQVLLAGPAPWNWESGDFGIYWWTVIEEAKVLGGLDGAAVHAYTHGPDPALIFDDTHMAPPGEAYRWQFRVYRDLIAPMPSGLPLYITESNQNGPWLDINSGWVRNAYREISGWNLDHPNKTIRCVALYRWMHDQWAFRDKAGVQADLLEAIDVGHKWEPDPPQETNMQNPSFEKPYSGRAYPNEIVAHGWEPFYSEGEPTEGGEPTTRPEYKEAAENVDPLRILDGASAQGWFVRWKVMDAGVYQRVTNLPVGSQITFRTSVQTWCSDSDDPRADDGEMYFRLGLDLTGQTGAFAPHVSWTGFLRGTAEYQEMEISGIATGVAATVFIRAWNKWALGHNDAYTDDASLTIDGGTVPPIDPPDGTDAERLVAIAGGLVSYADELVQIAGRWQGGTDPATKALVESAYTDLENALERM